jgi:hypothetical protein
VAAKGTTPDGKRTVGLESQVAHWATPTQRDHKGGAPSRVVPTRLDTMAELEFPSSRPVPDVEKSGLRSSQIARTTRPRLNSTFVEWLMGFPPAWTGCGPSGTEWCRWWWLMRSELSALNLSETTEQGVLDL